MTTASVAAPSRSIPPVMSIVPSASVTAAAPVREIDETPTDAHVPTACSGSASSTCMPGIRTTSDASAAAIQFFQYDIYPFLRWNHRQLHVADLQQVGDC